MLIFLRSHVISDKVPWTTSLLRAFERLQLVLQFLCVLLRDLLRVFWLKIGILVCDLFSIVDPHEVFMWKHLILRCPWFVCVFTFYACDWTVLHWWQIILVKSRLLTVLLRLKLDSLLVISAYAKVLFDRVRIARKHSVDWRHSARVWTLMLQRFCEVYWVVDMGWFCNHTWSYCWVQRIGHLLKDSRSIWSLN